MFLLFLHLKYPVFSSQQTFVCPHFLYAVNTAEASSVDISKDTAGAVTLQSSWHCRCSGTCRTECVGGACGIQLGSD